MEDRTYISWDLIKARDDLKLPYKYSFENDDK